MEQTVIRFLEAHHIDLRDKKILVGVSGGPDSLALLHLFKKWRQKWNLQVTAITIDHQLRPEAKEDVAYVRSLCQAWKLPVITEAVDVHAYQKLHKVSTQVAARAVRYDVFAKVMQAEQADFLALGHHADDQAETLLMSIIRTTNLSGMTGIPFRRPFQDGEIIRPLLAVTREEIEQYCQVQQLMPRIDSSNEDLHYTRNYIRKLVLPKLKARQAHLHRTMQALSESLLEDESYLQAEAGKLFQTIVERKKKNGRPAARIQIDQLRPYDLPLQRRLYRLTLDYLYESLPPQLSYAHERIFLSLLTGAQANKLLHFPQQLMVEVVYGHLEFYFSAGTERSFITYVHHVPAIVPLPNGNTLEISLQDEADVERSNQFICRPSQVSFPLQIRTRKPGDRMRYRGLNGSKKLKDIFIDAKIPRQQRDQAIVIADANDEILWLLGIRKGELTKPAKEERVYLVITYKD